MTLSGASFHMLQSWGVASARHTSATLVYPPSCHGNDSNHHDNSTEYFLDVPIGPSIVRWDIQSEDRCLQFQAHNDLVTCMRASPNKQLIATSSYSGEVKLWDGQWKCLDEVMAPMASQHHLAWSHDSKRFVVIGNGCNSSVVMYDVITVPIDRGIPNLKLKQAWQVKSSHSDNRPSNATTECSKSQSALEYHYGDAFYMGEVTPSGNVLAIEERPGKTTLLELFSAEGSLIKMSELTLDKKGSKEQEKDNKQGLVQMLFISEYRNGCYAIGVQGGVIVLVTEDLSILATFNVGITGRTCTWDKDKLVMATDSGKLIWWSLTGEKVKEFNVGSPDYVVRLDWSVSGQSLWMCGFSALRLLAVKRNENGAVSDVIPSHVIHSHEIACCGVGFSPSGRGIASGDLAGNVWVTEDTSVKPTVKFKVDASVRCVVWSCESVILVGGLDGHVYECKVGGACNPLLQLDGSVIHMRFNHGHNLLAIGSSRGMLEVYSVSDNGMNIVTKVLAHPPKQGPQDMKFGQLKKQAEIWSLCWSHNDDRLATCSEDQTTKIWDTSTWKCLATLTGHTTAVTSVDWKEIALQSLIATCADDRTIRLVDGGTYDLLRVLDTTDIYGWHTLTYLSFHPAKDSPLLLCTTQNGHVVVWNSITGQRITRGKMHLGSIEGLAWKQEGVSSESESWAVTVGADCVVNLFSLASMKK